MTSSINLLMPSAGRKVALVRALEGHFRVYCGETNPSESAVCLFHNQRSMVLPPVYADGFGDALLNAVRREKIQVVLPVRNEDMEVLEGLRENLFQAGAVLVQSPPATVEICLDKLLLYRKLAQHHFDTPYTEELGQCEDSFGNMFPFFVKPRRGSGSRRAGVVWSKEELEAHLGGHSEPMVVQPYVQGQEYTVDMFFDKGKLVQHVLRKRVSVANGQMDRGEVCADLDLNSYRKIVNIGSFLQFHGPVNVQFINAEEACYVTDINPRFSGGIGLSIAAGADFPAYLLELALGGEIIPRPVRVGTRAISFTDYACA
jgi:carbamoyl-phosphate synthase large subunit